MENKKPTVTAHVLVKNEENYIWYAINSVLPYVDKMIIFDTGSTDKTVEIINEIVKKDNNKKIIFEEKGEVDKQTHTDLRNEMIQKTETDWFIILDGDEVWPEDQILYLINEELSCSEKLDKNCVMVCFHLSSVDLYHYTEKGHFGTPWGLHGQFAQRLYKKVKQIHWNGEYLKDRLYYGNSTDVVTQENIYFSTCYYWHLSKLHRSSKDSDTFFRKKPSKMHFLPKFIKILISKKINIPLPSIFSVGR